MSVRYVVVPVAPVFDGEGFGAVLGDIVGPFRTAERAHEARLRLERAFERERPDEVWDVVVRHVLPGSVSAAAVAADAPEVD